MTHRGGTRGLATPILQRTTFESSRLLEFFTEKDLQMQIGHAKALWPIALLKEAIDNALDACESASIAPEVTVAIEADAIRVRDNGPGLPRATLERSLDYAVRVSDKAFYVSPTRGQLGNALKCIYAAPYVLDGTEGRVEITTGGTTYTITVRLDRLAQRPVLELISSPDSHVKTGTEVVMRWPEVASSFATGSLGSYTPNGTLLRFQQPEHLIQCYAAFNPHLAISYCHQQGRAASKGRVNPTAPAWRKWQPNHPTSPHWYTPERFRALLAAYITADRHNGRSRTVREVVAEFAGLSGTAKQKAVTGSVGLTGARLEDLVVDGDLDMGKLTALLRSMQAVSRPVKPAALGVIGERHLRAHLVESWNVTEESFRYAKQLGTTAHGLPFVVETAFGVRQDDAPRQVLSGVNFSPLIDAETFRFVMGLLGSQRIDAHDPVVLVVHLANPRVRFSDRGKSVLALEDEDDDDQDAEEDVALERLENDDGSQETEEDVP
ncbi:MAG TPA: ATP-binding protein [Candidatus Binatia bacterium]|nr:ATP-binding protein [Candidatus Binatia bacterium]